MCMSAREIGKLTVKLFCQGVLCHLVGAVFTHACAGKQHLRLRCKYSQHAF